MKKLILSAASLCFAGAAMAQTSSWNPGLNGVGIYSSSTSVGIGASRPSSSAYLSFPELGTYLGISDDVAWGQKKIISAGYSPSLLDYLDIQVPGSPVNYSLIRMIRNGNVGIGNAAPSEKLSVAGSVLVDGAIKYVPSSDVRVLVGNSSNALGILSNNDGSTGSSLLMYSNSAPNNTYGRIDMVAGDGSGATANNTAFNFMQYSNGTYPAYMSVFRDGKVTIGNISSRPGNYKLYVEQGILTEKVRVAIQGTANWADYVFADNYELKPLNEVESFINENKHLPDVPSAEEVVKDGIDVAAMNAKLLQKVEELTLYMIQQQKQMEQQQREIEALKRSKK